MKVEFEIFNAYHAEVFQVQLWLKPIQQGAPAHH
jgi:hypothetical protein